MTRTSPTPCRQYFIPLRPSGSHGAEPWPVEAGDLDGSQLRRAVVVPAVTRALLGHVTCESLPTLTFGSG